MDLVSIAMLGNDGPPPRFPLHIMVDDHIKQNHVLSSKRDKLTADSTIRVSSIPYICPREEVWYALTDEFQNKPLERLRLTYDFGNAFQDIVREEYLGPMGLLEGAWECSVCGHREVGSFPGDPHGCHESRLGRWRYIEEHLVSDEHNIGGHPDGVVVCHDRLWVLEIKTCNEWFFKSFKQYGLASPMLKKYHIQIQLYMWLKGLKDGIFLFFNKNTSEMFSLPVVYSEHTVMNALEFVKELRTALRERKLPRCSCDKGVHDNLTL